MTDDPNESAALPTFNSGGNTYRLNVCPAGHSSKWCTATLDDIRRVLEALTPEQRQQLFGTDNADHVTWLDNLWIEKEIKSRARAEAAESRAAAAEAEVAGLRGALLAEQAQRERWYRATNDWIARAKQAEAERDRFAETCHPPPEQPAEPEAHAHAECLFGVAGTVMRAKMRVAGPALAALDALEMELRKAATQLRKGEDKP